MPIGAYTILIGKVVVKYCPTIDLLQINTLKTMETSASNQKERQYYIDWLRILLIFSVFLFHIGMIFNSWDWHVKNDQTYSGALRYIMIFLHKWRMPLLFLISGAGTYYALGKRSVGQYLGERFKRLVIPLAIGIFTLVPIQVYVEHSAQYSSLLDFYPHMFKGIYPSGNFSWHHLWFIAYLFVIALIISPLLFFFRSKAYRYFERALEKVASKPLALNIFIVPLLLSQLLLRPYFPEDTHDLVHDWAAIAYFVIFFLAGFILLSNKKLSDTIMKQRKLFLLESALATALMFTIPYQAETEAAKNLIWDILSIFVAWSCGLTAIGFAKQYLNRDHKFRVIANEAIYPFYLLHQPVIVVAASVITRWDLSSGWKALLITLISFSVSIILYRMFIYRHNFMRIAFGMKALPVEKKKETRLIPVILRLTNQEAG